MAANLGSCGSSCRLPKPLTGRTASTSTNNENLIASDFTGPPFLFEKCFIRRIDIFCKIGVIGAKYLAFQDLVLPGNLTCARGDQRCLQEHAGHRRSDRAAPCIPGPTGTLSDFQELHENQVISGKSSELVQDLLAFIVDHSAR